MSDFLDKIGLEHLTEKIKTLADTKLDSDEIANKTASIPYGEVDSTSISTAFTATVDGITELRDGICMLLKNGVVTSASGFTININNLGAKPCYSNMATGNHVTPTNPTRETTIFNINYTMLFVYSSTIVDGGGWICYRGYDANTNTIGYLIRRNNGTYNAFQAVSLYKILFSYSPTQMLAPTTSTGTGTSKTVTTYDFDPFGAIFVYIASATVANGSAIAIASMWEQYTVDLRYSFNCGTITNNKDVYVKCSPQSNGRVKFAGTNPIVLTLPTTEDGYVYIHLGHMYSTSSMVLALHHPVYYYKDGAIREWTNAEPVPTTVALLSDASTYANKIESISVNGTALTPDTNKAVNITVPENISDLNNDSNYIREVVLSEQTLLIYNSEDNRYYDNNSINSNYVIFGTNNLYNVEGTYSVSFVSSCLYYDYNEGQYPNTQAGFNGYIKDILLNGRLFSNDDTHCQWADYFRKDILIYLIFNKDNTNYIDGLHFSFIGAEEISGNRQTILYYSALYKGYKYTLSIGYDYNSLNLIQDPFILKVEKSNIQSDWNATSGDAVILNKPDIPDEKLSSSYQTSTLENDNLLLAGGDTYETAFSKMEKAILDNEETTAAALVDLDNRLDLLHLPESLDDIPDGSTRKLSDYATTTQLATKQDTLVSGTNIKTINSQSLLGEGNITIEGSSSGGGDVNIIETIKVNGTALTPDANKAVNIDLTGYDKAPLVIEVNDTDTTVPSGTYASITTALAAGREVYAKVTYTQDDSEILYLKLIVTEGVAIPYIFGGTSAVLNYQLIISSNDSISFDRLTLATGDHIHGNILNNGTLTTDATIASGDKILITDSSSSNQIKRTSISFDGSTTTTALTPKGTWETFLKTAPVTSVNGQQGAVTLALGDTNVIETVKVNGTALTPDANKAVDITSIPANIVTQDATHRFVSDTEKTTWNDKVNRSGDTINGTLEIKPDGGGSALALNTTNQGSTAVLIEAGRGDSSNYHVITRDGNNNLIIGDTGHLVNLVTGSKVGNKTIATTDLIPTIPTNVSTFTNDAGYLTSFTETDPTVPSHVKAITTTDISNWNGKQSSLLHYSESLDESTNITTIIIDGSYGTNDAIKITDTPSGSNYVDISPSYADVRVITDTSKKLYYNNNEVATVNQIVTPPVTSVNGMTGAVTIDTGVTSFNGTTGAVTYTAPVTSVNGQTGAVTLTLGDTNVIEIIKVNGTALNPDANKAVEINIPTITFRQW